MTYPMAVRAPWLHRYGVRASGGMGMVLAEQDDEWQDGRRYFLPESMARIDAPATAEEVGPALLMAS